MIAHKYNFFDYPKRYMDLATSQDSDVHFMHTVLLPKIATIAAGGPPLIDNESFRELYLEHYSDVRKFFQNKGFSKEEAEEHTQEVFLRVFNYRGDFSGKGSLRGWLNTIAINLWKNRIREIHALKREAPVVSLDDVGVKEEVFYEKGQGSEPLENIIDHQHRALLASAIAKLPESTYACVVLRVYQELTYQEIATVLQIHYELVKSRMHQAQNTLKAILRNEMNIDILEP